MMRLLDRFIGWMSDGRRREGNSSFADLFGRFRAILGLNNRILTAMASVNSKLGGGYVFDLQYIRSASQDLINLVRDLIDAMDTLAPGKHRDLSKSFRSISAEIEDELAGRLVIPTKSMVLRFEEPGGDDLEAVGAKSARLAEIGKTLDLKVPLGASATTAAFKAFKQHNNLTGPIAEIKRDWVEGRISVDTASSRIRELILAGQFPPGLRKSLRKMADGFRQAMPGKDIGLAVRSSAWGEDGTHSFAGQYVTLLNEPLDNLPAAYLTVLAGAYNPSAMEYRREIGYFENELAMAVSFQVMVPARTSGVIYTVSPQAPGENSIIIVGTWGLGAPVVSGRSAADRFTVSREAPHDQVSIAVVRKEQALSAVPGGGVRPEPVAEELQTKACLSADEIRLLAQTALTLEQHFKKPQDIEYAFDQEGNLFILQTRPLRVENVDENLTSDLAESLKKYPVIFSGKGDVAQQGIACGPVFLAREGRSLDEFPFGGILVARHSSPSYAAILRRASGVITDVGSPVGHMATIAREFHVPTLLNTDDATAVLAEGQMITLDAEQKTVYLGQVHELRLHELSSDRIEETYEYRLLGRVLKRIVPLHLIDPTARNFSPEGCHTLHDLTRFIHEKAVEELVNISHEHSFSPSSTSGHLHLSVPMDMMVMDIGGGLSPMPARPSGGRLRKRMVEPEQVTSTPMRAFIQGVTAPGLWESTPVPVDFSSFMSSLTRTFSTELASPKSVGQNLAVLSDCYAHLSLRLGYHFTMINCYVSEQETDNYAYFRFTGGVTGLVRRTRRAQFLVEVLRQHDFSTTLQGDLVVARVKGLHTADLLERIRILGLLVAYTRQLDVSMRDDEQIRSHVEIFNRLVSTEAQNTNRRVAE